jgi:hypothetical protein
MSLTFFLILPSDEGHPLNAEALARTASLYMQRRDITGTARDFYDEFAEDGTEYGARIDAHGLNSEDQNRLINELAFLAEELFGEGLRVEVE